MDEMTLGGRLREIRRWHQLSLRDATGAAGLSVSVWDNSPDWSDPVSIPAPLMRYGGLWLMRNAGAPSSTSEL